MDKLALEIINSIPPNKKGGVREVCVQIRINDEIIVSCFEYPVNMIALIQSTKEAADYYFWTCHCGIPECALISTPIKVKHENNLVIWQTHDLPFVKDTLFSFDCLEYQSTVRQAWTSLKQNIQSNIEEKIDFEIYPDPKFTRLNDLLETKVNFTPKNFNFEI